MDIVTSSRSAGRRSFGRITKMCSEDKIIHGMIRIPQVRREKMTVQGFESRSSSKKVHALKSSVIIHSEKISIFHPYHSVYPKLKIADILREESFE